MRIPSSAGRSPAKLSPEEVGIQTGENYLSLELTIAPDHKSFTE